MNTLFVAILSVAISVAAQFSLKAGMSSAGVKDALAQPFGLQTVLTVLFDKFVVGGFVLYGVGAVVWLAVLSKWDVSKAYPLVGLGFVLTVGVGYLLGEQVSASRVLGVMLICAGVFVMGRT
jgi:multidrug transporter EmrE-like cation transporter